MEIPGDSIDAPDLQAVIAQVFSDSYRQRFGRHLPEWPVEILAFTVRLESPRAATSADDAAREATEPGQGRIWHAGRWESVAVQSWPSLPLDTALEGPLVVTDTNTTVLIPGGWTARRLPTHLDLQSRGDEK